MLVVFEIPDQYDPGAIIDLTVKSPLWSLSTRWKLQGGEHLPENLSDDTMIKVIAQAKPRVKKAPAKKPAKKAAATKRTNLRQVK